jgi:choline-sulfatase
MFRRAITVATPIILLILALHDAQAARPNVLLILGDDHAAYALSCYGHPVVRTPNLDRLAARGARFTRAYCNSPMCTPSRQSLLTGRMPHATGVSLLKSVLGDEEITLAETLSALGYRTAAIGKMHFNSQRRHGFDQQIDHAKHRALLKDYPPEPLTSKELPADTKALGIWRPFRDPAHEWLNAEQRPYGARDADMAGTYFADEAARLLSESEVPFFLTVSFYEPHSPFHFPVEFAGRVDPDKLEVPPVGVDDPPGIPLIFRHLSDREKRGIAAAYYTSVEFLDKNVGRVLDALDASGQADNTLIIYAGDHGYQLGHHGRFEKHTFFEEAIRAPLMMAWPGKFAPGQTVDQLVEFVDVFPTIAAAGDVELPPDRHGKSLLPLVDGSKPSTPLHDAVYGVYGENEEAMIRTDRWKLIYCSGIRARDDGYATDNPLPGRYVKLYDLESDPAEMTNLASRPEWQPKLIELKQRLVDRLSATCRPSLRARDGSTLDEQLDWYVFPAELRVIEEKPARD